MPDFVVHVSNLRRLERQLLEVADYEKQKLGQDLHDGLSQQISGIKFLTETLARQLARDDHRHAGQAADLVRLLTQAEDAAHNLARGLHPIRKEACGLALALEELSALMTQLYRRDCQFHCDPSVLIDQPQVAMHLYRIAQEAAGNAMKHGRPGRVTVSLLERRQTVVLEIHDNGRGFAASARHRRLQSLGLDIMHYRARLIGARLHIRSRPNAGTTVTCEWPRHCVTGDDAQSPRSNPHPKPTP